MMKSSTRNNSAKPQTIETKFEQNEAKIESIMHDLTILTASRSFGDLSIQEKSIFCKFKSELATRCFDYFNLVKDDKKLMNSGLYYFNFALKYEERTALQLMKSAIQNIPEQDILAASFQFVDKRKSTRDLEFAYLEALAAFTGCNQRVNPAKGFCLLLKVAAQQYPDALYLLASINFQRGQIERACEMFQDGVLDSDDRALFCRAKMAENDKNESRDLVVSLYERCFNIQAHKTALCDAAVILEELGEDELAFEMYQLSACQKEKHAQFNLAMIYNEGRIVPQNNRKSIHWLTRAKQEGHTEAQSEIDRITLAGAVNNQHGFHAVKAMNQTLSRKDYEPRHGQTPGKKM